MLRVDQIGKLRSWVHREGERLQMSLRNHRRRMILSDWTHRLVPVRRYGETVDRVCRMRRRERESFGF